MTKLFQKKDLYFRTNDEFTRNYTPKEMVNGAVNGVKSTWRKFNFIYIFAAILLIYYFSAIQTFNWDMVTNILYASVTVGIIGLGMALIILTGEIDLSVGSSFAFIAGLSVLSFNQMFASTGNAVTALIGTMFVAILLGVVIGFLF